MSMDFRGSSEQMNRIRNSKPIYAGHRDQRYGPTTYAQHGDDLVLVNIFENLGIERPSYLDIGAHHPETISNTKLLYDRGSRGVNVEVNPHLWKAFQEQRTRDINLLVGVTPKEGEYTLYLYGRASGRNTLDPREVERMAGEMQVREQMQTVTTTINNIVATSFNGKWPELLTIDIEGLDYDVLDSARWSAENRPKVVCVETRKQDVERMVSLMYDKGLMIIFKCAENLIFVDRDFQMKALTGVGE